MGTGLTRRVVIVFGWRATDLEITQEVIRERPLMAETLGASRTALAAEFWNGNACERSKLTGLLVAADEGTRGDAFDQTPMAWLIGSGRRSRRGPSTAALVQASDDEPERPEREERRGAGFRYRGWADDELEGA